MTDSDARLSSTESRSARVRAAYRRSHSGSPPPLTWAAFAVGALLLIVGIVALLTVNGNAPVEPGSDTAIRSKDAADFTLSDFQGNTVRLSSFRGRPVLVNLWASWCPPCRAEMPDLIRFYKDHQAGGMVLLAVDTDDTRDKAQSFIRDQQMPFPVLFDPGGKVMDAFGTQGLPSTFLIDPQGTVRFAWTGQITPSVLSARVIPLLSQ